MGLSHSLGKGTPLWAHEYDQVWSWHRVLQLSGQSLEPFVLLIVEETALAMHSTEDVSVYVDAPIED